MRSTDAEIGSALRQLRESSGRTATEVAHAARLSPTILLHKAETGRASLTGAELAAVLDALGANFQVLHLKLTGRDLDEAALNLLGAMATLMERFGR